MNLYATVAQLRTYLTIASQNEADDRQLYGLLKTASRSADKYTRRWFFPKRDTRYYDYKESQVIKLDADFLSLDTLLTQNGDETVSSGVVILQTGDNYNHPPYNLIVMRSDSGCTFNYSGTDQRANQVTGWWGYNEDYSNAWISTGASLSTSYISGAGSIGISGGSTGTGASDANGDSPRLSPGDVIRIDGEVMQVTAGLNNSAILVLGHTNGTSANHHAASTAIEKFIPEPDINWATVRMAGWLYGQGMTPYESKTAFVTIGTINIPQGMAADVKQRLDRFVRMTFVTYP